MKKICYNHIIINEMMLMGISYNKLFKLLIDKKMKKSDLCEAANISSSSLVKLRNGENVNTEILARICRVLDCDFGDIMELERSESTDTSIFATERGN